MSVRYSVDPLVIVRLFDLVYDFFSFVALERQDVNLADAQSSASSPKVLVFQVLFLLVNSHMKYHFSVLASTFAKLFEKCFWVN